MAATKTTGREQRKRSATGKARTPSLDSFYRYSLPPVTPGDFSFELTLLRPGLSSVPLDRLCESFEWNESSSEMTGSMQLRRPRTDEPGSLPIERGHRVRCRVRWAGSWYVLWTMRVQPPETNLEEGLVQVTLQDDMDLIKRTKRDWSFRQTKHRRFGYFPEEIVRLVCKRAGIRVGAIATGRHRLPSLSLKNATPLDVFKAAYKHEREKTGRSFVIRIRDGKLEIVPLKRNPAVYVLARQIQTAMLQQEPANENPATVLTGRGRIGSGKAAKKVSYTDYDRAVVKRFGYVHREKDYGRVESVGDLRGKVERDMANMLKVNLTANIQHAGIPFIRRGEGAKLNLPKEGFSGKQAFVYATTATHTVSAGGYTSTWDFTTDDPYVKLREEAEKAQREAKRNERKRAKK
jgi:hypothetical protein